jgi:excisionase family DNA binding protein
MDAHLVLTVSEAASVLRLSCAFTYELVARGQLPSVRFGPRIMIPRAAIQRILDDSLATSLHRHDPLTRGAVASRASPPGDIASATACHW